MRNFISSNLSISQSFIDAIQSEKSNLTELDYKAVFEFLTFGAFYFNETAFSEIRKEFTHQRFTLDKEGGFQQIKGLNRNPLQEFSLTDPGAAEAEARHRDSGSSEKRVLHLSF